MTDPNLRSQMILKFSTSPEPPSAIYAEIMGGLGRSPAFSRIPERMHEGLIRWVLFGIRPGDFLCAVISDSLSAAASRADDENRALLYEYAYVMHNATPLACWGPQALDTWKGVFPAQQAESAE